MDPKRETSISRFMSLVLRHEPSAIGLSLDAAGWASLDALCQGLTGKFGVSRDDVLGIVARDTKGRYIIDGDRIRANQGHSVAVELGLPAVTPPETLFHGTKQGVLESILTHGLDRRERTHVHLSKDLATAMLVGGRRRGETVILKVASGDMHRQGNEFHCSENGVWLTKHVPAHYLTVLCDDDIDKD